MADPSNACFATTYQPWIGLNLEIPPGVVDKAGLPPDALQVAAQIGRLDVIMMILAVVTLLVASSAVAGFWLIRQAAISAAEREIRQQLPELLPKFLNESCVEVLRESCIQVLKKNPEIIMGALRKEAAFLKNLMDGEKAETSLGLDGMDDEAAAKIADKIGEGGNNGSAG